MYRRLVEANLRQSDEALAEVERLFGTLIAGWAGIKASLQPQPETPRESAWMLPQFAEPELASAGWSF
jgi:flagellin-specific chaperone FliS